MVMRNNPRIRSVRSWGLFLTFFLFSACASLPVRQGEGPIPQDHLAEISRPDIPLVMNNRVQDWIDYFQGRGRSHFERYLSRSGKYIPMMRKILHEHSMPEDLVYLSMIESGFNPHAYSRARATGAWQFIYQTGMRYGLKVDTWVDERRDPEKSTVAAAKYLKDLYDRYNNWYLAAASYNAGEGKIDRAIRKYDTEDFWELTHGRYLKAETKNYVPKLIAAALIAKDPAKYGFKEVSYEEPVSFDEVIVDGPIDLRVVARCAGSTYEEIKALNPELIHWITPPHQEEYRLHIPKGEAEKFQSSYTELDEKQRMGDEEITVAKPQALSRLARKHGVPATLFAVANGIPENTVVKAGQTLTVPLNPPEGEEFYIRGQGRARGHHYATCRARSGDQIGRVSRRTGVSVATLKKNNPNIDWSHLKRGQTIRLYASESFGEPTHKRRKVSEKPNRSSAAHSDPAHPQRTYVTHRIRTGDTLAVIAKKYNVSTAKLKEVNGISSSRKLRPGQRIRIPLPQFTENNSHI